MYYIIPISCTTLKTELWILCNFWINKNDPFKFVIWSHEISIYTKCHVSALIALIFYYTCFFSSKLSAILLFVRFYNTQQDIMRTFKASPSQIRPPIISKIIQRLHSLTLTFLTLLFAIFEKQCPLLEATRSSNIQQRLSFKRKAQIRPCSNLAFLWSPFSIHAHFKILCG